MPYPSPHERGLSAQVRIAAIVAAIVAAVEVALILTTL